MKLSVFYEKWVGFERCWIHQNRKLWLPRGMFGLDMRGWKEHFNLISENASIIKYCYGYLTSSSPLFLFWGWLKWFGYTLAQKSIKLYRILLLILVIGKFRMMQGSVYCWHYWRIEYRQHRKHRNSKATFRPKLIYHLSYTLLIKSIKTRIRTHTNKNETSTTSISRLDLLNRSSWLSH